MRRRRPLDIAIVGMACRFPGASDLFAYWENILAGISPHATVDEPEEYLVREITKAALDDAGVVPDGRRVELILAGRCDLDEAARWANVRHVVDAGGASSLFAVELGSRSLVERRADLVVVVGHDGAGVGAVVLKRRGDADRDGDRVYALIEGVGISVGGLGESRARGQVRAMRRAYRASGIAPGSVGLVQGVSARRAALRALRAVFPSVESGRQSFLVGEGMAGLIQTTLALHHQVWPPTLDADPNRLDMPFTPQRSTRPWVHGDPSTPRRAGVNARAVGGLSAHLVLQEHPNSVGAATSGALLNWESEAFLLSAPDRGSMVARVQTLGAWLTANPDANLKDLAYTLNTGQADQPVRLGLVARSREDLAERLESTLKKLGDPACSSIRDTRGAYFWERTSQTPARVAFLFPGEGSQYPGMLADLCPHFPEVRALFDTADRIARQAGATRWPSEVLFGDQDGRDPSLWSAEVAVNVVLSAQWALYQLLIRLGIEPDAVLGHSSGEFLALAASGVVAVDAAFETRLGDLGAIFGRLETSGDLPRARLVALATARGRVDTALEGTHVAVAMDNCPHQVVIAGDPAEVEAVVARLKAQGVLCEDLPFDRAYHTLGFAPAIGPIERFFDALTMQRPGVPLYSCASHQQMPDDPRAIRELAVEQWTRPVEFRRAVEQMHGDGIDTFIDVGARGNLAGFVEDTLRGRPSFAVAANLPRRSGLTQLNHLVASLFARGVSLQPHHLYRRRRPTRLDLDTPGIFPRSLPAMVEPWYQSTTHRFPQEANLASFQRTMDAFQDTQQSVLDAYRCVKSPAPDVQTLEASHPWQGELLSIAEGREAVSLVTLEVEGDPVAEHHTLGGRRISALHREWRGLPVLPFSVMAEMLAQAASRLAPGLALNELRDVRAHKWIRYEDEAVALEIRAEVDPDEPHAIKVAIHNRGPKLAMRPLEPAVFEGVVIFGESPLEPAMAEPFALASPDVCRFNAASIYAEQWLFHGPALQAVVDIGPISIDGIEGTLRVRPLAPLLRQDDQRAADGFLTDPIILDNFTHLLGAWGLDRLRDDGDVIFPLRMEQLAIFGESPAQGSDVSCRIHIEERERHRVRVDADLVRLDGTTWMAIRGWEDWRFHWPGRYRDGFRQPDRTLLGEALDLPIPADQAAAVWLEPPADMGRAVWRDVLEHVQLGPDERAAYLAMPGPDLRRTHRLWGRIAAKEAARRVWLALGHPSVFPADLQVQSDSLGKPLLRSRLEPGRADLPAVSIAHVDGVAVALAAFDPTSLIGIDVEPIVERSPSFEKTAFLPGEVALLGDRSAKGRAEWVARFWCAKEAAAKATGQGFVEGPSGVEIVKIFEDGRMDVQLRGELARLCPPLGSTPFRVESKRRGDHVWAWTLGEKGQI